MMVEPHDVITVFYYGDICYLSGLGFTNVSLPIGINKTIYRHSVASFYGKHTLRVYPKEQTSKVLCRPDVIIIFFDSIETLLKNFDPCLFGLIEPIILVWVTNEGLEINTALQETVKFLKQARRSRIIFLEWKIDQTKRPKDLTFQETLAQTIVHLYKGDFSFGLYLISPLLIVPIENDLKDEENVDEILDNFLISLLLDRFKSPCIWWSVPNSNSRSLSSSEPSIKIKAASNARELFASIEHDDGDVHSLCFLEQDCSDIMEIIGSLTSRNASIKRLVIIDCKGTLSFKVLSSIKEGLQYLIIKTSDVLLGDLIFPQEIASTLRVLVLIFRNLKIEEVPPVIGNLKNLEYLDLTGSYFTRLPETFSNLDRLEHLVFDSKQVVFPPTKILERTAQEIIQYLRELQQKPVKNREAKVMVVGQEGVGKSTLVKSSKRIFTLFETVPPEKTDGIEISILKMTSSELKIFDLAGDVEYHNTHRLFFSPNCLHLVVFDLSNVTISKESRSTDQFCRLELWLETLASQDPNSYVIIVGTHLDHDMLSTEVLTRRIRPTLFNILRKYRSQHVASFVMSTCEDCIVCNPEKSPKLDDLGSGDNPAIGVTDVQCESKSSVTFSNIPHILGYFEVSGITNKNVKSLKRQIETAIADIKKYTKTDTIPERWLLLRQSILAQLSNVESLRQQPLATLTSIRDKASNDIGIGREESFVAMLRFFHSQGDFLWYEDIPEMKDVVILDPQWLSNQLCKLISHLPSVDAICKGFLHHSHLPKIWSDMSEENRFRLMTVFRSVGLCISVSDDEDLFPCKLPIGWPDREMWSPIPKPGENQTTVLFEFSFVPAALFPDLVIAINKRKRSFPTNVRPLYYRFNAVYITKREQKCSLHDENTKLEASLLASASYSEIDESLYHRIHMEMTPHTNSLKVTIRGSQPCCLVSGISSMIKAVKTHRYPGITFKQRLVCPECEVKRLYKPSTFDLQNSTGGFCSKGHKVGSTDELLAGRFSGTTSTVIQPKREIVESLDDHFCPKLFVVLPINLDSLSLKDRFVYSFIRDGFAVHLLCECPDHWHFISSPGFRIGKPKEFFKKYGRRVCKLLRVMSALGTPFKIASAAGPHCIAGAAVASAAGSIGREMKSLLDDYLEKYPHLKASIGSANDDLKDLKSSRGLQRSELSRFLEVAAPGRDFGPLVCTYVDKYNEWLWLCEEHYQQYEVVQRQ